MAYLERKRVNGRAYCYIMQSYRQGGKVKRRILEYLGRDPDPKRLKRALIHWGVRAKAKGKAKGDGR
jgi:hypothetical protein